MRGRLQLADGGDEYDGEFDGELPHGEGKRTYAATGAVYAGQWAGGEPTGTGEWRHPSSGALDVDAATAADILQRAAADGDTLDRNDFLHALVLWRSTARTRDRRARNESACSALA